MVRGDFWDCTVYGVGDGGVRVLVVDGLLGVSADWSVSGASLFLCMPLVPGD